MSADDLFDAIVWNAQVRVHCQNQGQSEDNALLHAHAQRKLDKLREELRARLGEKN
jgi:hypothetical protein